MIGQLRSTVLDCPEPAELAAFYAELLGASVVQRDDDWVSIEDGQGRRVSFQRSPGHRPPRFPDPTGSQQLHLDVLVDDPDQAERAALALGATRLDGQGERFRVFADPAGHPFCLVWLR
jgi:catechol 2,3-dioxygenase-like lactoylglutathione lyase family enzyme